MTPAEKQAHHIKWLKFAVLLSEIDIATRTEGQLLDLKNDYQGFLRSGPEPGPFERLINSIGPLKTSGLPDSGLVDFMGGDDVDIQQAQTILKQELENLATSASPAPGGMRVGVGQLRTVMATLAIGRTGDSLEDTFYFMVRPKTGEQRIYGLLAEHLAGSGIPAAMLRRCPKCQKVFLASRKPRSDRQLHCSMACSSNVAQMRYKTRNNLFPRAKNLFAEGKSIGEIAKLTRLTSPRDREWLEKKLSASRQGKARGTKKIKSTR